VSQNGQDNKCLHSSQNKIIIHLTVVVNMTKFTKILAIKKRLKREIRRVQAGVRKKTNSKRGHV